MASQAARAYGVIAVIVLIVVGGAIGTFLWAQRQGLTPPVAGQERCVATAAGRSVSIDLEQARYASVIAGISVRRGLPARAATIALTTAYQESGIRNLTYGDRDSVGLFQQRPSQGWGTRKQILDPDYSTGKFYDALVKIKDWESGDITEIAQRVQRSGYPDAYRDHEADAKVLSSALTGQSPEGFSCLERRSAPGDPKALAAELRETFRSTSARAEGSIVRVDASSADRAWAYGSYAVANAARLGITGVQVGGRQWRTGGLQLPSWEDAKEPIADTTVVVTLRS